MGAGSLLHSLTPPAVRQQMRRMEHGYACEQNVTAGGNRTPVLM